MYYPSNGRGGSQVTAPQSKVSADEIRVDDTVGPRTQPSDEPVSPPSSGVDHRKTRASGGIYRYAIFFLWIAMIVVFGALKPHTFLTTGTLQAVLNSQSALVILALAIVPTLVVSDYDLSVAANAGLTSTIIATCVLLHKWPLWVALILAIGVAALIGAINALLVVRLKLNSIIMTLGMATLIDGVSTAISGSQTLSGISSSLSNAFTHRVIGIQISVLYIIVVAALLAYVIQLTPLGRQMTFVGQAPQAAVLAGIDSFRLRFGAYVGGALLASLSGIAALASQGGIQPGLSETQLLPAFAAAFFSTVVFTIGRFNAWGTVVAIYFLTTGIVGLQVLGMNSWVTDVFYGGALVLAVAGFTVARRRLTGTSE